MVLDGQVPDPLAGCCEDGVTQCWCERADASFANTTGSGIAFDNIDVDLLRSVAHASYPETVKVAMNRPALFHGHLAIHGL